MPAPRTSGASACSNPREPPPSMARNSRRSRGSRSAAKRPSHAPTTPNRPRCESTTTAGVSYIHGPTESMFHAATNVNAPTVAGTSAAIIQPANMTRSKKRVPGVPRAASNKCPHATTPMSAPAIAAVPIVPAAPRTLVATNRSSAPWVISAYASVASGAINVHTKTSHANHPVPRRTSAGPSSRGVIGQHAKVTAPTHAKSSTGHAARSTTLAGIPCTSSVRSSNPKVGTCAKSKAMVDPPITTMSAANASANALRSVRHARRSRLVTPSPSTAPTSRSSGSAPAGRPATIHAANGHAHEVSPANKRAVRNESECPPRAHQSPTMDPGPAACHHVQNTAYGGNAAVTTESASSRFPLRAERIARPTGHPTTVAHAAASTDQPSVVTSVRVPSKVAGISPPMARSRAPAIIGHATATAKSTTAADTNMRAPNPPDTYFSSATARTAAKNASTAASDCAATNCGGMTSGSGTTKSLAVAG